MRPFWTRLWDTLNYLYTPPVIEELFQNASIIRSALQEVETEELFIRCSGIGNHGIMQARCEQLRIHAASWVKSIEAFLVFVVRCVCA